MTVIFHGEYKTSNFGDLLLLAILAKSLSPLGIKTEALFLKKKHEKQTFCKSARLFPHFVRSQVIVYGGGGYISSQGPKKKLLRYTIPGGIARALRIPYIIVGPGSDDKLSKYGQQSFRFLANGACQVIVRDNETATVLKSAGTDQQIDVGTDLAFALRYEDVAFFAQNRTQFETQKVLIGLNFPSLRGKRLEQYFDLMKKHQRVHKNIQYVWIYDNIASNESEVRACALRHDIGLKFLRNDNIWDFAEALSRMRAIFTSKLHVGIVAWTLDVAVAGLSTHEKTQRFYKKIDRESFQVNGTENLEFFDTWLQRCLDGEKQFFNLNFQRREALRAEAKRALEIMQNFVLKAHG